MKFNLIDFIDNGKSTFCYGAGEYAFWVTMLVKLCNLDIEGYIETSKNKNKYLNKKVYGVNEIRSIIKDSNIIIAVSGVYHDEITNNLSNQYNCKNIYLLDEREFKQISNYLLFEKYKEFLNLLEQYRFGYLKETISHMIFENNISHAGEIYKITKNDDIQDLYVEYYELKRKYGSFPRYKEVTILFQNKEIIVPDMASFFSTYKEILLNQIYKFKPENDNNLTILDIGANIGLASLFFSKKYPNAKIIAFEADKHIYEVLKHNMDALECNNVEVINQAIWDKNEKLLFYAEGADGGRIDNLSLNNKNMIKVDAVDIDEIMTSYATIDFLKIDIEGAETKVLERAANHLEKVSNIFIEYHSQINKKQTLNVIINILSCYGFRVYINTNLVDKQPCMKQSIYNGFDMLINIFGIRENV